MMRVPFMRFVLVSQKNLFVCISIPLTFSITYLSRLLRYDGANEADKHWNSRSNKHRSAHSRRVTNVVIVFLP